MVHKLAVFAAWLTFGLICFATLSPIWLRPEIGDPRLERFVAYAALGALLMAAYPRHFVKLAVLLAIFAAGLEAMQHLTPDRHGHVPDAMEKIVGAWAGCAVVRFAQILTHQAASQKAG
jgi:hypothetical protein